MPDIITTIESADRILRRVEDAVVWAWGMGILARRMRQRRRLRAAAAEMVRRCGGTRLTGQDLRDALAAVAAGVEEVRR
jgi:hypothetical protein